MNGLHVAAEAMLGDAILDLPKPTFAPEPSIGSCYDRVVAVDMGEVIFSGNSSGKVPHSQSLQDAPRERSDFSRTKEPTEKPIETTMDCTETLDALGGKRISRQIPNLDAPLFELIDNRR